jgi:hypothetical protein
MLRMLITLAKASATGHTPRANMRVISMLFGDRTISQGLWPPPSPNLSPPNICPRGYLKHSAYGNNSHNLDELKPEESRHHC